MRQILSVVVISIAVSGAAVAAQSPAVKGNTVKFSGCVTPGTEQGSFLLTNVKRTDGAADTNTI